MAIPSLGQADGPGTATGSRAVPKDLLEQVSEAGGLQPAEDWKKRGNDAYARKDWEEAIRCYTAALEHCRPGSDLGLVSLNNRAACYAQLKSHVQVVRDASEVLKSQPANSKALLRRMVALEALGRQAEALEDAGAILTMEPQNQHAKELVARKRKSLTKKATDALPSSPAEKPRDELAVFLFSEDRPLQCYACLRSAYKHLQGVTLNVQVFWSASNPSRTHSYQLLESLRETNYVAFGKVAWSQVAKGQIFDTFSRAVNRLGVEGQRHVLLLSDTVVFHSAADVAGMLAALSERREAFAARLDLNPRVEFFPEANLCATAPQLQPFASNDKVLLWTRSYDASRMAFEAVPREAGWDAILEWTATMIRVEHVQHFFSALLPPPTTLKELDDRAADWLSRRQRMKRSEISHRSACFASPVLVTLDPAAYGSPEEADTLLRGHLYRLWGAKTAELSRQLGWSPSEVSDYFKKVSVESPQPTPEAETLLEPERLRTLHLDTIRGPAVPSTCSMPRPLHPPNPLVSWLVPARNAENFVLDCLESIESQSSMGPGSYEIILIEDSSEDGTLALLRQFARDRPHVRLVEGGTCSDTPLGLAGSLQQGWLRCRGDFVARLDADDEATADRLVKQLCFLEQHKSVSLLGGAVRPFWTEQRKCTVEKAVEKEDGRVAAAIWREFHGQQTSRRREQLTLVQRGREVLVVEGPAEFHGCRLLRVGEESISLKLDKWKEALKAAQGGVAEVLLQRRDPLEPPKCSRWLHPLLVRAGLLFEDAVAGTTMVLRRAHFAEDESPFPLEDAEGHWCCLSLEPHQHVANIADPIVRARRHETNRGPRDEKGIYKSRCRAVQTQLLGVYGQIIDHHDAQALLNLRGPRNADQGTRLLEVLEEVEQKLVSDYIRPSSSDGLGDFWRDFVQGREVALERALEGHRRKFKVLTDEVAEVITKVPDHSPREKRSRTPPR